MKAYGLKHKKTGPCVCEMCGANDKRALKSRERFEAKKEIKRELQNATGRQKARVR